MFELLATAITAALVSSPAGLADHPASCAPDRPARIAYSVTPDVPQLAQDEHLTGMSVVRIDLSKSGAVTAAYIAASSGSSLLDRAAIRTAKSIIYEPATRSCATAAGSYDIEVEFDD